MRPMALVQLVHRLARQRVGHLDGFLQRSLVRRFDRFHRCQLFLLTSGDGQGAETREGILVFCVAIGMIFENEKHP